MPNALLREIHRLRKHLRECQAEIDRVPKTVKAHQTKVQSAEKAMADAKESLKKRRAEQMDLESRLKGTAQNLAKYERQLNEAGSPKEYEAKQTEINNAKKNIADLEDQILSAMADVEARTAKIPEFESAVVKAKADSAAFERDSVERIALLNREIAEAKTHLENQDAQFPNMHRAVYDRLVKAHGADSFATITDNTCGHCRVSITVQQIMQLEKDEFLCCRTCGRVLYLSRSTL